MDLNYLMFPTSEEQNIALDFVLLLFYEDKPKKLFDRDSGFAFYFPNTFLDEETLFWRQSFLRVHSKFIELVLSDKKLTDKKLKDFRRGGKYQFGSLKLCK